MVLDIYNWLYKLKTDPGTIIPTLSSTAQSNHFADPKANVPLTWSNSLSMASQQYINEIGLYGKSINPSIYQTARNMYAPSICTDTYEENSFTHQFNLSAWDVSKFMNTVLE